MLAPAKPVSKGTVDFGFAQTVALLALPPLLTLSLFAAVAWAVVAAISGSAAVAVAEYLVVPPFGLALLAAAITIASATGSWRSSQRRSLPFTSQPSRPASQQ